MLNRLIQFPISEQTRNHDIRHLQFADKLLNKLLQEIKLNYQNIIPREDSETMALSFLFDVDGHGNEIGILNEVDTSYDDAQIIKFVHKRFKGFIENQRKELLFNENVISESLYDPENEDDTDHAFDDNPYSMYEQFDFNEWIEIEYSTTFSNFIKAVGGLDEILTDQQYKVLTMSNLMSQKAVADELEVSEANISQKIRLTSD